MQGSLAALAQGQHERLDRVPRRVHAILYLRPGLQARHEAGGHGLPRSGISTALELPPRRSRGGKLANLVAVHIPALARTARLNSSKYRGAGSNFSTSHMLLRSLGVEFDLPQLQTMSACRAPDRALAAHELYEVLGRARAAPTIAPSFFHPREQRDWPQSPSPAMGRWHPSIRWKLGIPSTPTR